MYKTSTIISLPRFAGRRFGRCKTELVYPLALGENQDFAASVLNFAVSRLAISNTLPLCSNPSHKPIY